MTRCSGLLLPFLLALLLQGGDSVLRGEEQRSPGPTDWHRAGECGAGLLHHEQVARCAGRD